MKYENNDAIQPNAKSRYPDLYITVIRGYRESHIDPLLAHQKGLGHARIASTEPFAMSITENRKTQVDKIL